MSSCVLKYSESVFLDAALCVGVAGLVWFFG